MSAVLLLNLSSLDLEASSVVIVDGTGGASCQACSFLRLIRHCWSSGTEISTTGVSKPATDVGLPVPRSIW
jgi:hypothetical protein